MEMPGPTRVEVRQITPARLGGLLKIVNMSWRRWRTAKMRINAPRILF
jgi:hypothetical protein